jgi:hypothetical protein
VSDLPKIVTVGIDGRPYAVITVAQQRPGHWQLDPPRALDVFAGAIALSAKSDELRADGGKNLWTAWSASSPGGPGGMPASIAGVNALLMGRGSPVRLKVGTTPKLVGRFPHYADEDPPFLEKTADGKPTAPNELLPIIPTLYDKAPLVFPTSDCGKTACLILGIQQANARFVIADGRQYPMQNGSPQETALYVLTHLLCPEDVEDLSTNFNLNKPLYQKALNRYIDMPSADQRDFDRQHGMNKFARPTPGEAFVIVNLDMRKVNDRSTVVDAAYHHHWGAVLMNFGMVQVTLENQDGHPPDGWSFAMYGNTRLPMADVRGTGGETFHGIHSSSGCFRQWSFTFAAMG